MSEYGRQRPLHVPTLTEVVDMSPAAPVVAPEAPEPPAAVVVDEVAPEPAETITPEINEAQLAQKILVDVQKRIDSMLEFRLRESMQPLLAQFIETLMADLREELSRTMRDVVNRSVAQELAKWRNRDKS